MTGRAGLTGPAGVKADARRHPPVGWLIAVLVLVVAACGGPVLANPPLANPSPPIASPRPSPAADPAPIAFPRDDGPHRRLTEWWYYTGHLQATDGRRFGFEAVVFRAERGSAPPAWASHLALTDEAGRTFHYAQRSEVGPAADHSPRDGAGTPSGFDLQVSGLNPVLVAAGDPAVAAEAWRLAGSNGHDTIDAALTADEAAAARASFGLHLDLESTKPPALHDGDGFVAFGPAGESYYYSRTRMAARGVLELDGASLEVTGIAWFDHQWGDFISIGGGWNWFAINLDDGTDITISQVLDDRANDVLVYGTLVTREGGVEHLNASAIDGFEDVIFTSPVSGRTYPVSWNVIVGDRQMHLEATIPDQELDTRPTTGVMYWEGSHIVTDLETGERIGDAYVEITRYRD